MSAGGHSSTRFSAVVVVASLGGLEALSAVLAGLPAEFPVPVFLAQHGKRTGSAEQLAGILGRTTVLPVHAGEAGAVLPTHGVTVIPAGYATTVRRGRLWLTSGSTSLAGDALFTAVAGWAGAGTIGVVLTGLQRDGTLGARAVKQAGGRVIAQDPATARGASMPDSAIATGCVDYVLPITHVAPALVALTMASGAAELLAVPTPPWAQLRV